MGAVLRARGDKAALGGNEKIKLSNMRAEFTTFNTGGSLITTPDTYRSERIQATQINLGLIICNRISLAWKRTRLLA